MEKAKVTILLAAYKGNEFAGAQIDSILAQDCGDWQLILSDDGEETADLLVAVSPNASGEGFEALL